MGLPVGAAAFGLDESTDSRGMDRVGAATGGATKGGHSCKMLGLNGVLKRNVRGLVIDVSGLGGVFVAVKMRVWVGKRTR